MPLDFDGTNDAVDLGSSIPAANGVGALTVMAWVNMDDSPSGNEFLCLSINNGGVPTDTSRIEFGRITGGVSAGAPQAQGRAPDAGAAQNVNGTTIVPNNAWMHVAMVFDFANATFSIYEDGVLDVSAGVTVNATTDATDSAAGAIFAEDQAASGFSDGRGEDFRIYNRALTADEIQTIFQCRGVDGIVEGLVNRWLLNEGPVGSSPSGAGSIKDVGPGQRNVDPVDAPVYAAGEQRYRRRVA